MENKIPITIGVLGATGYTGAELLRLLINHKSVKIVWLTSEKFSGQSVSEVFPHLKGCLDVMCESVRKLDDLHKVDLVFSCLPHGTSMHFVAKMLERGSRVIDFSADFRFSSGAVYEKWFKTEHRHINYLKKAAYGLPELYRDKISDARLIANPGCYATSVILGIAPLVKGGLVKTDSVIADIKSGMSGGGRAPNLEHHFSEANEGMIASSVSAQNQKPEIEQELKNLGGSGIRVTFIPHQVSIDRGILATVYCRLQKKISIEKIHDYYTKFYKDVGFVRVLNLGNLPKTKNVRYSNMCDIGIGFQDDVFVSVVAIDNLGKGASGQAMQSMNLMFGFPESEGLKSGAVYP